MTNTFFNFTTPFSRGTRIRSEEVNPLFVAIERAFDQVPTADMLIGGADFVTTTGSGGLYTATRSPALTTISAGTRVRAQINHTSPANPQLNLDNLGFRQIRDSHGAALSEAALSAGSIVTMDYDGAVWRAAVVVATVTPTDGSVTNAKLASVPGMTIKGRAVAGVGAAVDLDAATARALLGVAQSATASNDFTTGRGLIVGSGGIGGNAPVLGAMNVDLLTTGNRWAIASAAGFTNLPVASPGVLTVVQRDTARIVQIYDVMSATVGPRRFTRFYDGATWTAWAQSALLVASGVTSGTTWEQWSDGRMTMRREITQTAAIATAFVGGFRSTTENWAFPQTFTAEPRVIGTPIGTTAASVICTSRSATAANIAWTAFASQSSAALVADVTATGAWF